MDVTVAALVAFCLAVLVPRDVEAGKRTNVQVRGTTMGPNFIRPEATPTEPCPSSHPAAFANGSLCCAKVSRKADAGTCPGSDANPILLYTDPAACCDSADTKSCPSKNGKCRDATVRSQCPKTHPAKLHKGLSCCRRQVRGAGCSTGAEGTALDEDDPVECCPNGSSILCEGGAARCDINYEEYGRFCPLNVGATGVNLWKHPTAGMPQATAKATCISAGFDGLVVVRNQTERNAVEALTGSGGTVQYWIDGRTNGQSCSNAACTSAHIIYEDGGPPYEYGGGWLKPHLDRLFSPALCLYITYKWGGANGYLGDAICDTAGSGDNDWPPLTVCKVDCGPP